MEVKDLSRGVNTTKEINITNDTEQTLSLELLPPIEK